MHQIIKGLGVILKYYKVNDRKLTEQKIVMDWLWSFAVAVHCTCIF